MRCWRIVGEFEDRRISGAKGREKRPGFDRLLKAATTHKIDVVAAWSVDRLGARCRTLSGSSENSARSGAISILSGRRLTRPPQPATPSSKCSGFAEFERSIIQERVKAGMAWLASTEPGVASRSVSRRSPRAKVEAIRAELARGTGILKTTRRCGTGVSAVQRTKRALSASQAPV